MEVNNYSMKVVQERGKRVKMEIETEQEIGERRKVGEVVGQ